MYAKRIQRIAPFRVVELLERAKQLEAEGREVVHLEVGEPDFPTAQPIIDAAHRALDGGATKYTQAMGIPALRERIAHYYQESSGIRVAPERVVVTSGASAGLLLLSALLLDPGDELLLTDPGYPCNEVFVWLVNGEPVRIPLLAEDGFQITPAQVEICWSPRTRGLLLASPANPTGTLVPGQVLVALAELIRGRGGFLILDEIYQGLTYGDTTAGGGDYRSGLSLTDDAYVLNSFSKYFGMTGWRLGWMVLPEQAVPAVARLAQNLFISPASLSQHAALAAFEPAAMAIHEQRRQAFEHRLTVLVQGLEELGFVIPARPAGAFYVYADISHTRLDAVEFCRRLLEEFYVAATPGVDFGERHTGSYVRFAFTASEERIRLGLARLEQALRAWGMA
ncbi:MAG: aminotransferase class I/II-fold pyridoxal phosphate-dependent enzyme [Pseudomonadales bacterium]